MGSPTSQSQTLEFILSKDQPMAKLTPEEWVKLLESTLDEIGGQFEYLKVWGLNGLYSGGFHNAGFMELDKQLTYELYGLTRGRNGRHYFIQRNKTWAWLTFSEDVTPYVVSEYRLGLKTSELLPLFQTDAEWPYDGQLAYELYAGLLMLVEKGINRAHQRVHVLEENLKHVRQQGLRVRALYESHPPLDARLNYD